MCMTDIYPGNGHYSGGMWHPDYNDEDDYDYDCHGHGYGSGAPGQLTNGYTSGESIVQNTKIKGVDLKNSALMIAPLVRNFRENGCCTVTSYRNLLSRMCGACEVPRYKKNRPVFLHSPDLPKDQRGVYACKNTTKILKLHRLGDLRAFIILWFLYLEGRNDGFIPKGEEEVSDSIKYRPCLKRARAYCKEILETSEPQQVRNLETRAYVEILEL